MSRRAREWAPAVAALGLLVVCSGCRGLAYHQAEEVIELGAIGGAVVGGVAGLPACVAALPITWPLAQVWDAGGGGCKGDILVLAAPCFPTLAIGGAAGVVIVSPVAGLALLIGDVPEPPADDDVILRVRTGEPAPPVVPEGSEPLLPSKPPQATPSGPWR